MLNAASTPTLGATFVTPTAEEYESSPRANCAAMFPKYPTPTPPSYAKEAATSPSTVIVPPSREAEYSPPGIERISAASPTRKTSCFIFDVTIDPTSNLDQRIVVSLARDTVCQVGWSDFQATSPSTSISSATSGDQIEVLSPTST